MRKLQRPLKSPSPRRLKKRVLTAPRDGLPGKTVAFPLASLGFVGFIAKNLIWCR
jgi:hypothetical protein